MQQDLGRELAHPKLISLCDSICEAGPDDLTWMAFLWCIESGAIRSWLSLVL